MSVCECGRVGCTIILCVRYSSKYGYICSECFAELSAAKPKAGIKSFMESPKDQGDDGVEYNYDNVFTIERT